MANCKELKSFLKYYPVILEACKEIVQARAVDLNYCCDYCLSIGDNDDLELTYYNGREICCTNIYFDEINEYLSKKS